MDGQGNTPIRPPRPGTTLGDNVLHSPSGQAAERAVASGKRQAASGTTIQGLPPARYCYLEDFTHHVGLTVEQ